MRTTRIRVSDVMRKPSTLDALLERRTAVALTARGKPTRVYAFKADDPRVAAVRPRATYSGQEFAMVGSIVVDEAANGQPCLVTRRGVPVYMLVNTDAVDWRAGRTEGSVRWQRPAPAPVEPAPVEPAPVEPAPVEPTVLEFAPVPVEPEPESEPALQDAEEVLAYLLARFGR